MSLPAYALAAASFPQLYERVLVAALFRPWAETLLARLDFQPGSSLIDVACGTGIVARLAAEAFGAGRVVGVDNSAPMLAVAREIAPALDWREGDALALPVAADEPFDVVVCQQGLQFFADRAAALDELHRVAVPNGLAAVATWVATEDAPLYGDLQRVAERHVGPIDDQRHSFGEASALARSMKAAGFGSIEVEHLAQLVRFPDAEAFVHLNAMALVGMARGAGASTVDERSRVLAAIEDESRAVVTPYLRGKSLVFETRANLALARA